MSNLTPEAAAPAIQAPAALAPTLAPETEEPAPREKPGGLMLILQGLASLRLTVVLFVLSFLLVLLGTLAQIDYGIGTVIKTYFRSFFIWVPFRVPYLFFVKFFGLPGVQWKPSFGFPYPGGLTLGFALMVNLVMAHILRFKLTWERSGVLITHVGLTVLLLGEFITAFFAVEGRMRIEEGETVDTIVNIGKIELAFSSTADAKHNRVTTVPASFLRREGTTISNDELPFDIVPGKWFVNSDIKLPGLAFTTPAGWKRTGPREEERQGVNVKILDAFSLAGGEKGDELTVTSMPAAAGRPALVNRWRGQVGLPPLDAPEADRKARVADSVGDVYDLDGPDKRMLVAVVRRDNETWFFKLLASRAVAAKNVEKFNQFLSGVEVDTENNPVDKGVGLKRVVVPLDEVAGTEAEQRVDTPSLYATLYNKDTGKEIGTYLFSVLLNSQDITVGDTTYKVALRFEETRRPYTLKLKEFHFDRHAGTNEARNFSSLVQLHDPDTGEDREVLIRMNEPLRHRGETFFQSGWNDRTERGTILQVVRNPGWTLPYVSCIIVALGLCIHFGISLVGFLERKGV
jgi:hypothetical protein